MDDQTGLSRRAFGGAVAALAVSALAAAARASERPGAPTVKRMIEALQSAKALSFDVDQSFGASVAKSELKTLGNRAHVVFERPDSLFAVFGVGGGPDVQLLITGGEATLFRLSLASKTVLKLAPENGAAFSVPGLFLPFLGLLATDVETEFFGGITSVTPLAEGAPGQKEKTTLAAVMGKRFTGEAWIGKKKVLPARVTGTWFGAKGDVAASAAVNLTSWSTTPPAAGQFNVKGLQEAKRVEFGALGL